MESLYAYFDSLYTVISQTA